MNSFVPAVLVIVAAMATATSLSDLVSPPTFRETSSSQIETEKIQRRLDTGEAVLLPSGDFYPTRPLVLKTDGQSVKGAGRSATRIHVRPGFAGEGVFTAVTKMAIGPALRDFSVDFDQPDTGDYDRLLKYPPAFNLKNVSRFEMAHIGCFSAMTCVDMKGSGGATIEDMQFSAFDRGIEIDGSLDTTRILNPHWFPFNIKPKQQALFASQGPHRPIGISIGRADHVIVAGGLFLGGLGVKAFETKAGQPFGMIEATDFDTYSGLEMSAGSLRLSACIFNVGGEDSAALSVSGGALTIVSSSFYSERTLSKPLVRIAGHPGYLTTSVTMSSVVFDTRSFDTGAIRQDGGILTIAAAQFSKEPGRSYRNAVLDLRGGRTIMTGSFINDKGVGTGVFMNVENDNPANRFIANASPGWTNHVPARPSGLYLFN